MTEELITFDKQQALKYNANFIVGIDEAGRGPLAGPVVACACFIPPEMAQEFADVNDSKKLTEAKREEIFERLQSDKIIYGLGSATAAEIDELNILQATFLAMRRAAEKLKNLPNALALVDGPYPAAGLTMQQQPVIDGDALSLSIAAASILAKVTRDRYMCSLDEQYPEYRFSEHKGYGTAKHMAALKKYGPCPEHRKTFGPVRKLLPPPLFLP
jgi:ribonuclease HII